MAFDAYNYLKFFRFEKITRRNDNYMTSCPDFKGLHARGDKRPSFGIHGITGLNNCFACHEQMNLEQLTARLLSRHLHMHVNEFTAWLWLEEKGWTPTPLSAGDFLENLRNFNQNNQFLEILDENVLDTFIRGVHPSIIHGRGISVEAAKEWELCYDQNSRYTVIPVRNELSLLVGFVSRAVKSENYARHAVGVPCAVGLNLPNKYVFKKALVLYGENRLRGKDTVLVVESPLDVVYAWSYGLQNEVDLVALFGANASAVHIEKLLRFKNVILALDNDEAGKEGTANISRVLQGKVNILHFDHFGAKDLGEVSPQDLQGFREHCQPIFNKVLGNVKFKV